MSTSYKVIIVAHPDHIKIRARSYQDQGSRSFADACMLSESWQLHRQSHTSHCRHSAVPADSVSMKFDNDMCTEVAKPFRCVPDCVFRSGSNCCRGPHSQDFPPKTCEAGGRHITFAIPGNTTTAHLYIRPVVKFTRVCFCSLTEYVRLEQLQMSSGRGRHSAGGGGGSLKRACWVQL